MSNGPTVMVDGEPVAFDGPPPSTPRQCLQLLAQALGEEGRVLTRFEIDGRAVEEAPEALEEAAWKVIKAFSENRWDYLLMTCAEVAPQAREKAQEAHRQAVNYLTQPWSQTLPQLTPWLEGVTPVMELAEALKGAGKDSLGPAFLHSLDALQEGIEALVTAAEETEVAIVSEQLSGVLAPSLEEMAGAMTEIAEEKGAS